MLIFHIPGEPVPRRERIAYKRLIDDRAAIKRRIKWCLKGQYREEPLATALKVTFAFYMAIPASTTRIRKRAMLEGRIRPTKKPDCSNLIKLYEDCMTGIAYQDDRFIVSVHADKFWAERPSTIITITPIEDPYD